MSDVINPHSDALNRAAEFLPMTKEDELPAVRIGDALVFVYLEREGRLRITVDTEDMDPSSSEAFPEWPDRVPLTVNVNDGTVFDRDVEI
jgi:hypothetical protein